MKCHKVFRKEIYIMKHLSKLNKLILISAVFILVGCSQPSVRRFGQLSQIKPGQVEKYKNLHTGISPEVVEQLRKYHVQNYSIYTKELQPGQDPYLFSFFEYTGKDFDGDMAKMMEDPTMRKWQDSTGGQCLKDMSPDSKDIWRVDMEEVFFMDGDTQTKVDKSKVERYGWAIGLKPEMVESYKLIHKYPWSPVLNALVDAKVRNYPIYLNQIDGKPFLFAYFEYVGDNFTEDMAQVDGDPVSKAWMKFTDDACQVPIPTRAQGEWWAVMEEVFHMD